MTPEQIDTLFLKHGLPVPVREHQFHPTNKWRFDYALLDHKVAMEVDGGIWSGGRHVTPEGRHKDMNKMNQAAILGWRILYITPKYVGTMLMIQLFKDAIK